VWCCCRPQRAASETRGLAAVALGPAVDLWGVDADQARLAVAAEHHGVAVDDPDDPGRPLRLKGSGAAPEEYREER